MKKIKLAIFALAIAMIASTSYVQASFPVKNEQKSEQTIVTPPASAQNNNTQVAKVVTKNEQVTNADAKDLDEKWITLLLWFFLGGVAAHRWYKKKPVGWNILFILTAGGCGIWAIVDLVNILTDNF